MPEDMPDRMSEDYLPVAKCINVMAGITRSKVICVCDVYLAIVLYDAYCLSVAIPTTPQN